MLIGIVMPLDLMAQSPPAGDVTVLSYARVGLGAAMSDPIRRAPAIGFGVRAETRRFAVDVSALNLVIDAGSGAGSVAVGSLLRLQGLRFLSSDDRSPYLGAGLALGVAGIDRLASSDPMQTTPGWHGHGLQVDITSGYEIGRASDLRLFVQADSSLPLFQVGSQTYASGGFGGSPRLVAIDSRFVPSLAVSLGLAWKTGR
jgi:hypothetical protein